MVCLLNFLYYTRVLLGTSAAASYLRCCLCCAAALVVAGGLGAVPVWVVIAPLGTEHMMMASGRPRWLSGRQSLPTAGATGNHV